jgi:hypothetical protein
VEVKTAYGTFTKEANITKTNGKISALDVDGAVLEGVDFTSITTEGDSRLTRAEEAIEAYILRILQDKVALLNNPWSQSIYGKPDTVVWPTLPAKPVYQVPELLVDPDRSPLNPSQEAVVSTMLSSPASNQIMVVQGPPGTGKVRHLLFFADYTHTVHS